MACCSLHRESMVLTEKLERAGIPPRDVIGLVEPKNLSTTERRYPDVLYRNGLPYCKFGICGGE